MQYFVCHNHDVHLQSDEGKFNIHSFVQHCTVSGGNPSMAINLGIAS